MELELFFLAFSSVELSKSSQTSCDFRTTHTLIESACSQIVTATTMNASNTYERSRKLISQRSVARRLDRGVACELLIEHSQKAQLCAQVQQRRFKLKKARLTSGPA